MLTVQSSPEIPISVLTDPVERAARVPTVLVAAAFEEGSAVALRRGRALARALDATVTVLHVADDRAAALRLARRRVAAAIVDAARETHAAAIVLGAAARESDGDGAVTAHVITHSTVPVLVARPERPGAEILAATNLVDSTHPTLHAAARLGARLGARVTFMHDMEAGGADVDERLHDLTWLARYIGIDVETVVTTQHRPVDAILDVAERRDADLLVVGVRHRHGTGSPSTALTVARRAHRSVLVVPLTTLEPTGRPS